MARRRYRKYYRHKGRWSSNIREYADTLVIAPTGVFYNASTLTTNPAQDSNTVSQQYTVKNVECTFELLASSLESASFIDAITAYIVYVPQGMNITNDYISQHPEYIMAYRYLGSPQVESSSVNTLYKNPIKVRTRLARRLQTGDSIRLLLIGYNEAGSGTVTMKLSGIVRWWTKAN